MLDLARLESDRLELHRRQIELKDVAVKAAEHRRSSAGRGPRRRSRSPRVSSLTWTASGSTHVLTNLIENAVKFSDEGPITVSGKRSTRWCQVTVTDSGVGIEADRLGSIFLGPGPTGQVATPLGTGLGLYLSRKLVEAHGGTLEVESTEGEGSTFTMLVPAGEA